MKLIKSRPRYRCDFCLRTATKPYMEAHEKICWKNPNRFCELCENKGYYYEDYGVEGASAIKEECIYCSKFNSEFSDTGE